MKLKPWSKLQHQLYNIVDTNINFQIHCSAYPMDSVYGSSDLPRYFITLDKEIIWDYPKQFVTKEGIVKNLAGFSRNKAGYPYQNDVSEISLLIREYIDTPTNVILSKVFINDYWGLINILRAADRRIGKRRLEKLRKKTHNIAANKVLDKRLEHSKPEK